MQTMKFKNWLLLTALGFLLILVLSFLGDGIDASSDLFARIYNEGENMGNSLNDYLNRNASCQ
jgi:hypothetical protein